MRRSEEPTGADLTQLLLIKRREQVELHLPTISKVKLNAAHCFLIAGASQRKLQLK